MRSSAMASCPTTEVCESRSGVGASGSRMESFGSSSLETGIGKAKPRFFFRTPTPKSSVGPAIRARLGGGAVADGEYKVHHGRVRRREFRPALRAHGVVR